MSTQTIGAIKYPDNQFLEGGVLFGSVRQYLNLLIEDDPRGRSAFTQEMWETTNFPELFSLMARRTVKEAKRLRVKQAKSRHNIILNVDSYKVSMPFQYPANTTRVYSYIASRGGMYDDVVFAGVQMIADEYLTVRVTADMVDEAAEVYRAHGEPFYREGWDYIVKELDGKLPIVIRAVEEGTVVSGQNVLLTIENTDDKCWWLTTHVETAILRGIWYPTTVASRSFAGRKVFKKWLDLTSDNGEALMPSRLHDFGGRSATSAESAEIGGFAHLFVFDGTDTIGAIAAGRRYYDYQVPKLAVAAAEHSTITSWGRDSEVDAYRNMLRLFARPGSLVSVVSDSYDLWNAIQNIWGTELRQHVVDSGALVIIRPDSGDVLTVPVEAVRQLSEKFGYTVNSKGYKVLKNVAVIQGDGIDDETVIDKVLANLAAAGFAADNIAFGMGSGLLQKVNRDTLMFAMKCSAIMVDGEWRDVFKAPVDAPSKASRRGRLALVHDKRWETVPLEGNKWRDQLSEVFRDGELVRRTTHAAIRQRIAQAA